jgi:DNA repair exonuclease SbcCD nuclease subunit
MGTEYRSNRYHEFFQRCSDRFPHVIYIVGNHEYYNGDFGTALAHLRDVLGHLPNLHLLEKQAVTIGDITFLGGTLWTDMNREDPDTLRKIRGYMNDYRIIENSSAGPVHYKTPIYGVKEGGGYDYDNIVSYEFHTRVAKFTPEDSVEEHKAMLKFVTESISANPTGRFVVVGHHSPSKLSTKPQYENDTMVNGAYSSDLNEYMIDHPQIKLWTHGHTHHEFDYMIGSTRVFCNPRGYIGYENQADTWKLKTVDI